MSEIVRFSVSVEQELLDKFDRYCNEEQLATRSEAVRQMIRELLTRRAWESGAREVVGTLTLVYSHESRELSDKLNEIQHHHHRTIISATHIHLP